MRFLTDFEPLRPAERKLLNEAVSGGACWITTSRPAEPSANTEIRASFVRFLALGGDEKNPVHETGVRLNGAYIIGSVVLDGAENVRPLWLQDCTISDRFTCSDAKTKVICLDRSWVKSIRGDSARIAGSFLFRDGVVSMGAIRMFGAEINGTIALGGATIKGVPWQSQRLAIDLTTASVGGNVELKKGFKAEGIVLLDDAGIGGLFDCSDGHFGAHADPRKTGASLGWDAGPRALKCHRLNLKGSLYLRDAACADEISFSGAEIGGDLDCRHGDFKAGSSTAGVSMRFTRAEVGGSILLSEEFASEGKVEFGGAKVGGTLDCSKGGFNAGPATDGSAMRLTRAEIGGNVYLGDGFNSFGKIELNGAKVGGNLDCRGGTFTSPPGKASKDLAATKDDFSEDALSLVNAEIAGALIFAPVEENDGVPATFNGSIDLKSAKALALVDSESAWPGGGRKRHKRELRDVIHLDGFIYERFAGNAPTDAKVRRRWLYCQTDAHLGRDFKPQPFEQAIKVLKAMGHDDDSRRLAIAKQKVRIRKRLSDWRRPIGVLEALVVRLTSGALIGYGYRPQQALFVMILVGVAFGFYFKQAAKQAVFAPRDPQMFLAQGFDKCREVTNPDANWTKCADERLGAGKSFAEFPPFNPWIYSFDVLLPIFDLRQAAHWVAMDKPVTIAVKGRERLTLPKNATTYAIVIETIFGWIGSLLVVAGFSGLVKTE